MNGADLMWAELDGADMNGAILTGAKLKEADLNGAIFHINQAVLLKEMDANISKSIFVDDNGEKVNSDMA